MALAEKLKLARLILLLLRPGDTSRPDPRVQEEIATTPGGARFALYRPRRGRARATVVAVHGGDRAGWRNVRLIAFARSLARCEVACAVPELAGLARCAFDALDLDALEAVCVEAPSRTGGAAGLVGFSYGGGYSLSVAARPSIASQVRFVVSVGGFHSLPALFDWYLGREHFVPTTAAEWDDEIYLRLVLAWWFREPLAISPGLGAEMESLLDRFCEQADVEEKRAFYERHLRSLEVFPVAAKSIDRALLARLSPEGRTRDIRCPVTLIHDRFDSIVPLRDAERLHREIGHSKLVVTEVLSHVTPSRALDVLGLARLTAALEPLVTGGG